MRQPHCSSSFARIMLGGIEQGRVIEMSHPPEAWVGIGAATTPVFSRDGNTIWHLRGGGLPQVWSMDRDGGNARAITAHGEKTWKLSRSPADDRLLWAVDAGGDEHHQLYLREADGSGARADRCPRRHPRIRLLGAGRRQHRLRRQRPRPAIF